MAQAAKTTVMIRLITPPSWRCVDCWVVVLSNAVVGCVRGYLKKSPSFLMAMALLSQSNYHEKTTNNTNLFLDKPHGWFVEENSNTVPLSPSRSLWYENSFVS